MKAKRAISLILCAAIIAAMAGCTPKTDGDKTSSQKESGVSSESKAPVDSNFNETGLPIVNEPVTLKAVSLTADAMKPVQESELYLDLEKRTNVKIDYTLIIDKVWPEKKGILFTSGDLPDFFVGDNILTGTDVVKYGTQGQIIELQDYMAKYNPYMNAKLDAVPSLRKAITAEGGKIYSYLGIDNSPMQVGYPTFINKEWLDKLNLPIPTTTEELYTTLKAFKTKDPNGNGKADEIPMTAAIENSFSDYFGAFGVLDVKGLNLAVNHIGVKDDATKVYYTANTEGYKSAIQYFNRLFSEGLLDPEAFSQDASILNGKIKAEERIIGLVQGWRNTTWQRTPEDTDYVTLPPVKGPNGDQQWPSRYAVNNGPFSFGSGVITSTCKSPEIVARWMDEFYEPDFSYQLSLQLRYGLHVEKQADGSITPLALRDDFDVNAANLWFGKTRIHNMIISDYMRAKPLAAHIQQKIDIGQPYLPFIKEKDTLPSMLYTATETEEITQLATDINGYADECYARWITSGGIDKEWDAYVKQLETMGVNRFVEIYQGALDRYNAS